MHPARLNYLAYNNPVKRRIETRIRDKDGHWSILLECGHSGDCVGHFDIRRETEWTCSECSIDNVKTNPRWAKEWGR